LAKKPLCQEYTTTADWAVTIQSFFQLRVEYLNENQEFEYLATIDKKELQDIFKWKYVDTAPVTPHNSSLL